MTFCVAFSTSKKEDTKNYAAQLLATVAKDMAGAGQNIVASNMYKDVMKQMKVGLSCLRFFFCVFGPDKTGVYVCATVTLEKVK